MSTKLALSSSKALIPSFSLFPSSVKPLPRLVSSVSSARIFQAAQSKFTRNVAVTSDYDVDEDDDVSDRDDRSFSPDLKLFVGNLPFNVDSTVLAGLFARAGNVEMVEVIYDKITGRSRGFGFVTMSTVEEVEAAAEQFNGYEMEGRQLRVNSGPPPPKEDSPYNRRGAGESSFGRGGGGGGGGRSFDNSNRVYVGNLAWSVDNMSLENLFSEQGKVVEAKVVYDRDTGRSRGFGFVTYASADEVNRAIDSLNGADLDGRQLRVSVAEAPQRRQF
jgi:nucleolin